MNRQRVEEIRERWTGPLTEMYPSGTEEADYRDVRDLLAEIDELHTWRGLMRLLDEHWPEDAFPTVPVPYEDSRDDGARIVALTRWVGQLQDALVELDELRSLADQLQDELDDDTRDRRTRLDRTSTLAGGGLT